MIVFTYVFRNASRILFGFVYSHICLHIIYLQYFYRTAEIMLGNCESMTTIGDKSEQSKGTVFFTNLSPLFHMLHISFQTKTAYYIHIFLWN